MTERARHSGGPRRAVRRPRFGDLLVLAWALLCPLGIAGARSATAPGAGDTAPETATAAVEILFYGSSFTSYNDMPAMLRRLAAAADPPIEVADTLVARPGYSLNIHWRDEQVQQHLQRRPWDVVILQEQAQAPLRHRDRMATYAGHFTRAVEAFGGRTVLLMAWAPRRRQAMTEPLAAATEAVGRQVGAEVAPVGRAWFQALAEHPALGLHSADGKHPAPLGSYFTACVLLTHLFEDFDARGLPPLDLEVSADDLATVQRIAWESRHGNAPADAP